MKENLLIAVANVLLIIILATLFITTREKLNKAEKYIIELEDYIGESQLMDTVGSGDAYWNYYSN